MSLKQFKVSDEMSRNLCEIPTNVIRFTFVVLSLSYGLRKCAPACGLHKCAPA